MLPLTARAQRLQKSKPRRRGAIAGNEAKFLSYAEAWARIRIAVRQGFFFEAVAIQESILSDRLTSFLVKTCGSDPSHKALGKLNDLIGMWGKQAKQRACEDNSRLREIDELQHQLDAWRAARNEVIHGLVRGRQVQSEDRVEDFLTMAQQVARDGETLARLISRWVRRESSVSSVQGQPVLGDINELSKSIDQ
jgi:hypothetical protein